MEQLKTDSIYLAAILRHNGIHSTDIYQSDEEGKFIFEFDSNEKTKEIFNSYKKSDDYKLLLDLSQLRNIIYTKKNN